MEEPKLWAVLPPATTPYEISEKDKVQEKLYMNSMKFVIPLHLINEKRLKTMLLHHNPRVNSHLR